MGQPELWIQASFVELCPLLFSGSLHRYGVRITMVCFSSYTCIVQYGIHIWGRDYPFGCWRCSPRHEYNGEPRRLTTRSVLREKVDWILLWILFQMVDDLRQWTRHADDAAACWRCLRVLVHYRIEADSEYTSTTIGLAHTADTLDYDSHTILNWHSRWSLVWCQEIHSPGHLF